MKSCALLLEEALSLPLVEREAMAAELWESVKAPPLMLDDEALERLIAARNEEMDSGAVRGLPVRETLSRMINEL